LTVFLINDRFADSATILLGQHCENVGLSNMRVGLKWWISLCHQILIGHCWHATISPSSNFS